MTLTVLDLGCFPHGHEVSIETLIDRFMPHELYGFDPFPELLEGETVVERRRLGAPGVFRTVVRLERKAAWTEDGEVEIALVRGERAWDTTAMRDKNSRGEWSGERLRVPCFDLSRFILALPAHAHLIVKMDVEGAEFPLLEHLLATGADSRIGRVLVEWHDQKMRGAYSHLRRELEQRLRCPLEEWVG